MRSKMEEKRMQKNRKKSEKRGLGMSWGAFLTVFATPEKPWGAVLAPGAPARPKLVKKIDFWRFEVLICGPKWCQKSTKSDVKKRFVSTHVSLLIFNDSHSIWKVKHPHFLRDFRLQNKNVDFVKSSVSPTREHHF